VADLPDMRDDDLITSVDEFFAQEDDLVKRVHFTSSTLTSHPMRSALGRVDGQALACAPSGAYGSAVIWG
jgi:hypothetical protein